MRPTSGPVSADAAVAATGGDTAAAEAATRQEPFNCKGGIKCRTEMEQVHRVEEAEEWEDSLRQDRAAIAYARNAGMSNRTSRANRALSGRARVAVRK